MKATRERTPAEIRAGVIFKLTIMGILGAMIVLIAAGIYVSQAV